MFNSLRCSKYKATYIYIKTFVPMTSCAALINLVSVLFVIFGLYFFSAGVEHAGVAGRAA